MVALLSFVTLSCGNTTGSTPGASTTSTATSASTSTTSTSTTTPSTTATGAATSYTLTATGSTSSTTVSNSVKISVGGTAALSIAVLDSTGATAPDGTVVSFTLSDSTLGSLSTTAAAVKTGVASVTFTGAAGKSGTETITATSGTSTTTIEVVIQPTYTVTVTATPATLTLGGTASLSATIKDSVNANAPDGTAVTWSINDSALGTITASSTTVSGVATATFNASYANSGTVTITATNGSFSGKVDVVISPAATGSIVFTSATPQVIGVKASGQTETSIVVFNVIDINGNPVADGQKVDVCLRGPSGGRLPSAGGEYLGNLMTVKETFTDANGNGCYDTGETFTDTAGGTTGVYDSPTYAQVSTVGGAASVSLQSGKVAGNASLFATLVGKSLSTASPTISIGGGVPAAKSLTNAATKLSLPGYTHVNKTSDLSTFVADRFGDANILEGTTVNYYTNAGAVTSSTGVIGTTGSTMVTYRTQDPEPPATSYRTAADIAYVNDLALRYGVSSTIVPHNGLATILVTVVGEEDFTDLNGNGIYDTGEPFTDSVPEPFIDSNGNGTRDDGTTDLWELYVDVNGNGVHDGTPNTVWDSSKVLFKQFTIRWTGATPFYVKLKDANVNGSLSTTGAFSIDATGAGGLPKSKTFTLLVADKNLNALPYNSTISISSSGNAGITGTTSSTVWDTNGVGATELSFTLTATYTTITPTAQYIKLVITTPDGGTFNYAWSGLSN